MHVEELFADWVRREHPNDKMAIMVADLVVQIMGLYRYRKDDDLEAVMRGLAARPIVAEMVITTLLSLLAKADS